MPKPVYWAHATNTETTMYTSSLVPDHAVPIQLGRDIIKIDYTKAFYLDANGVQHSFPALHFHMVNWAPHRLCFRDQSGGVVGYIEGKYHEVT